MHTGGRTRPVQRRTDSVEFTECCQLSHRRDAPNITHVDADVINQPLTN
jgi:hypothetical protein